MIPPINEISRDGFRWLREVALDDAFFDRTTSSGQDISLFLLSIAIHHKLPDAARDMLFAVGLAMEGRHGRMRISVDRIPEGVVPREMRADASYRLGRTIADKIDQQVAHGVKQEAAVEEAMHAFGLSRREVFRMLSDRRAERRQMYADEGAGPPIDGYLMTEDGRLVPAVSEN